MTARVPILDVSEASAPQQPYLLKVQVECSSVHEAKSVLSKTEEVCSAFASATRLGAFATIASQRAQSQLHMRQGPTLEDETLSVLFDANAFHAGSFQYLRNMMMALQDMGTALYRIVVSSPDHDQGRLRRLVEIKQINESSAYPANPATPSIERFTFSDASFAKSRRVLVEFEHFLSAPQQVTFSSYVDCWYNLLELGAFSQPFGTPGETMSVRGRVARFDATTLEIHVARYVGSEVGFKVFGGMLDHFAGRTGLILSVEID